MKAQKSAVLTIAVAISALPVFAGVASPADAQTTGYPNATNTGWQHTGVTLTTYSSPCTITVAGTVIDSKDIKCDELIIRANNVTIKRSRMVLNGSTAICNDCDAGGAFLNLLVEDVEIDCNTPTGTKGRAAISAPATTPRGVCTRTIANIRCGPQTMC